MYPQRKPALSLPGPNDILRQTLPNGITLLARENFASPTVVISGYITAGAADEPAVGPAVGPADRPADQAEDRAGLAGFTADVMERGTHHRSFAQLYEEVESIAASFGLNSGVHTTAFGAKGLVEDLPLLLDILNDVLRHPAFTSEQVEKARAEILTDIQEREHDTRRMAGLTFRELAYPPEHPYHRSQLGYTGTIARITRDDLVHFHERFFTPQDAVIAVVGAVKAADAVQAVTQAFGDWQAARLAPPATPDAPKLTARIEKRIAVPDKTQSNLVLGWPGPARLDPDFIPAYLANTVLGVFGLYGRLGRNVREANGLAYYVHSSIDGGMGPGPWRVSAGIDPGNIDKAVELIIEELHRIRDTRIPTDELNDSKSYLVGNLPLQLETNEGVAHALINMERYHLGLDYLQHYAEMINAITADQIQGVVQRWLDPEHYALAIAEPEGV